LKLSSGVDKPPSGLAVSCSALLEGVIDILAVADFNDVYDELVVFNSVHDAILTLTNSIAAVAREFLTSRRARVISELLDPLYDALAILLPGNGLDFLQG
jgi:hypothetical protein